MTLTTDSYNIFGLEMIPLYWQMHSYGKCICYVAAGPKLSFMWRMLPCASICCSAVICTIPNSSQHSRVDPRCAHSCL